MPFPAQKTFEANKQEAFMTLSIKTNPPLKRHAGWIAGLICFIFCLPAAGFCRDDARTTVRGTISKTMDVEKQTQQAKAVWADEASKLSAELEQLEQEIRQSRKHLDKLTSIKILEEKKHGENLRREKEVERLKNELSDFLETVVTRLETHVLADIPFLKWERKKRIAALKELLPDPSETPAEKFRRIFNALQIETEYGITVEVTQDTIMMGDKKVMADLLRIGRLALFSQTIDQKSSAVFDPFEKKWQLLPDTVNQDISDAIAMARLERTVEIVNLPLGRIQTQ